VARGLAGVGDFFQVTTSVPRDSTVDAASTQYGVGFDRNGDGKIVNRTAETILNSKK